MRPGNSEAEARYYEAEARDVARVIKTRKSLKANFTTVGSFNSSTSAIYFLCKLSQSIRKLTSNINQLN